MGESKVLSKDSVMERLIQISLDYNQFRISIESIDRYRDFFIDVSDAIKNMVDDILRMCSISVVKTRCSLKKRMGKNGISSGDPTWNGSFRNASSQAEYTGLCFA